MLRGKQVDIVSMVHCPSCKRLCALTRDGRLLEHKTENVYGTHRCEEDR